MDHSAPNHRTRKLNLSLRSGKKLRRTDDVEPSAAMSRSPVTSTVSPVRSTRAVATTPPRVSSGASNDRNWWPHSTVTAGGSSSCSRRCRSPQRAARKLKSSSLVSVRAAFVSLSVALFCGGLKTVSSQLPMERDESERSGEGGGAYQIDGERQRGRVGSPPRDPAREGLHRLRVEAQAGARAAPGRRRRRLLQHNQLPSRASHGMSAR